MMLALSEGWYAESEDEIEHMLASFPFPNVSHQRHLPAETDTENHNQLCSG
jgi:hypothetical protein